MMMVLEERIQLSGSEVVAGIDKSPDDDLEDIAGDTTDFLGGDACNIYAKYMIVKQRDTSMIGSSTQTNQVKITDETNGMTANNKLSK